MVEQQVQEKNREKFDSWLNGLTWQPVDGSEFKKLSKEDQLFRIRHSSAHIMAEAIRTLRPDVSFATGPATGQGFFYDVHTSDPLKEDDLEAIQKEVDRITSRSLPFEVTSVSKKDALTYFEAIGQRHKLQVMERIADEQVTLYRHSGFIDLCAGPHVPHTGLCRNMKVLTLSGAHWRDEAIPSMTRVSGTAWATPKDLQQYLEFLEESKLRDHRFLGPQLELFSFHPWATAAMWHPKGVSLRQELMNLWRQVIARQDYIEIMNPLIYRKDLYETSGHWDHYRENMFIIPDDEGEPSLCVKPMNCPDTMLYYQAQRHSYRELPLRIAEGQILHRNEATGAMHGLMRTRMFIQDDAHIFLAPEHVEQEIHNLMEMVDEIYTLFQLPFTVKLSTRPENFMGDPAVWDTAESSLKAALEKTGKPFTIDEGEGAFYGPKVDIFIQDSLGREWQCGTIQLDFQLPARFDLKYVDQDGAFKQPIVIHRAVFGSFERFIGILIEHLGGAFPTWLAPLQVNVLPIAERHFDYAKEVAQALKKHGVRVEVDYSNETVNNRIRQSETSKVPYALVVGDREVDDKTVAVRRYSLGQQGVKPVDEVVAEIVQKIASREFDIKVKNYAALFRTTNDPVSTEAY